MKQEIIVMGAPRSGTTFLGDVLSRHPSLHYMIEPSPIWKRYVREPSDMVCLSEQRKNAVIKTRTTFKNSLKESGLERLLEKTPQNCLRFPFVHAVFPEAKFINIIRNGEESALSIARFWESHTAGLAGVRIGQRLREMSLRQAPYYAGQFAKRLLPARNSPRVFWGPVLPGMSDLVKVLSSLEIAALQWRTCVELSCHYGRTLPASQYMEIKLENWGPAEMKQILDFVGLSDADCVMEAFLDSYDPTKTSHRKKNASDEELRTLRPWIESTMHWLEQT